ncbi:MAG: alanine--tRNA ligase-related protein [Chloroflexota bacterium]
MPRAGSRCPSRAWTRAWAWSVWRASSRASPPTTTPTCSRPSTPACGKLLGHDPDGFEAERFSYQVIADHSRAITFLAADGVLPSNEGRGYVMRRICRQAVRHGRLLGRREPFLGQTAEVVIETMGEAYPILRERRDAILGTIVREEAAFARTLDAGTVHLEEALIPLTSAERVVGRRRRRSPRTPRSSPATSRSASMTRMASRWT